jgi:DNA-binding cell septation regulator SpoVG
MTTSVQEPFEISDWKAFTKNTLRGFFTVTMSSGMILHNCSLHVKNSSRWIGMPSQKYTAKSGESSYKPIVEFSSHGAADRFRDAVLQALDRVGLAQ